MKLVKYKKIDIALNLLEKAILVYGEGNNYFAALHLAGASEEILGNYLKMKGKKTSLESDKEAFILMNKKLFKKNVTEKEAIKFLNDPKNATKHMDIKNNNKNNEYIVIDPKASAESMIDRAITNWWHLNENITPLMENYWDKNLKH